MSVNFTTLAEFDNHEMVLGFYDEATKLKGYIGIHSTKLGMAVGGTRFFTYDSDTEAVEDALRLSRAMSYKNALTGLPYGGGKAVLMAAPGLKTPDYLRAYGRVIENLGGLFKTGTDVGITDADVLVMNETTRHMIGAPVSSNPTHATSSGMAALGVFYAIEASLKHRFGSSSVRGHRIGVKGLGKLGGHLAELLHAAGASLVIADVDPERVRQALSLLPGATVVDADAIHREELDVYAPCAMGHEFTMTTIKGLRTQIIAGGANNQLSRLEVGDKLHEMGVLYAPDYIANAGGLIHVTGELEEGGYDRNLVHDRVQAISDTLARIFDESERRHLPTCQVADELAVKLINQGGHS